MDSYLGFLRCIDTLLLILVVFYALLSCNCILTDSPLQQRPLSKCHQVIATHIQLDNLPKKSTPKKEPPEFADLYHSTFCIPVQTARNPFIRTTLS